MIRGILLNNSVRRSLRNLSSSAVLFNSVVPLDLTPDAAKSNPNSIHPIHRKHPDDRETILQQYLSSGKFTFAKDKEVASLQELKRCMEIVYLNKKPLIAIDFEAYERSLKKVTEIGIVIYDPDLSKGSIFPIIKTFHIIIAEHIELVNGRYVPDSKDKYIGGLSNVLSLSDSKIFMEQIIEKYINQREGAFVGHNIGGDIRWLQGMGIQIREDIEIVDTFKLYQISRSIGGTLKGILKLIDLPHGVLHNAANDAYYTLLAAIAYCDPNMRNHKDLDTYKTVAKKSTSEKRRESFATSAIYDDVTKVDELLTGI
ncbi:hypothetical protein DFJ63DRAFT_38774 [Scheffersomyces coipomensis]|uniref:uncharacterized protein n=1 Tax=Scheffersomyces coipomensis TaxID=1788519 RepID=UPI00315D7B0C